MTEKVLISGGAGFIGSHLAEFLTSSGHAVTVLDNLHPQIHGQNPEESVLYRKIIDKVRFVRGDVTQKSDWLKVIDGQDIVFHLAAQTGTGQSMYEVSQYTNVNVGGTAALWDILANNRNSVKKVVLSSSRAIYGEGAYRCANNCGIITAAQRTKIQLEQKQWDPVCPVCLSAAKAVATPETLWPDPASLYACSKLAQEQMCISMGKALGISVNIFRFQNVYGPGQSLRNPYTGIISIFSNLMRQNLPIDIFEDGKESRDFVFVEDIVKILQKSMSMTQDNILTNIGTGKPVSVLEMANILKDLWQSRSEITVSGHFRVGDIRHNWADLSRFRKFWPDFAMMELKEGLAKFVAWAKLQPAYEDKTRSAQKELQSRNF